MNAWDVVGKMELTLDMLVFSFVLGRNLVQRRAFGIRALTGIILCFWGSFLLVTRTKTMWESIPGIILMFLLVFLTFLFCFENSIGEVFFINTAAYICQIILYSIFIVLNTFLGNHEKSVTGILYFCLNVEATSSSDTLSPNFFFKSSQ